MRAGQISTEMIFAYAFVTLTAIIFVIVMSDYDVFRKNVITNQECVTAGGFGCSEFIAVEDNNTVDISINLQNQHGFEMPTVILISSECNSSYYSLNATGSIWVNLTNCFMGKSKGSHIEMPFRIQYDTLEGQVHYESGYLRAEVQ